MGNARQAMNKIEHIGIAVKDIKTANEIYKSLLGYEHYKTENVESENVTTSFFRCGESKIELLEATNENSPIAKFIDLSSTNPFDFDADMCVIVPCFR